MDRLAKELTRLRKLHTAFGLNDIDISWEDEPAVTNEDKTMIGLKATAVFRFPSSYAHVLATYKDCSCHS
jgi:hypothetical protein